MRKKLRHLRGRRLKLQAKFQKYGVKNGTHNPIETVALADITRADTGEYLENHVWVPDSKPFRTLGHLYEGELLEFYATVEGYERGYPGWNIYKLLLCPRSYDYGLTNIGGVRRLGDGATKLPPQS